MLTRKHVAAHVNRKLAAYTRKTAAHQFHLDGDPGHAGDGGGVMPRDLKVIGLPNVSSETDHTPMDVDIDVPRVNIRIREQLGLNLVGNIHIGRAFGWCPTRRRRTSNDPPDNHYR